MLIAVAVCAGALLLSFGTVMLIRWTAGKCDLVRHIERFPEPRRPECLCLYDFDGGSRGRPHWIDGVPCLNFYIAHNRWPAWCVQQHRDG